MNHKCEGCGCEILSVHDKALRLCKSCADSLGVIAMPPARRRLAPCRCCNGMSFVRAIPREVAVGRDAPIASPMAVTIGGQEHGVAIAADPRRAFGLLEIYVCRACGYVEWYCADPQDIPIGPQFMTELIEPEPDGPYR